MHHLLVNLLFSNIQISKNEAEDLEINTLVLTLTNKCTMLHNNLKVSIEEKEITLSL